MEQLPYPRMHEKLAWLVKCTKFSKFYRNIPNLAYPDEHEFFMLIGLMLFKSKEIIKISGEELIPLWGFLILPLRIYIEKRRISWKVFSHVSQAHSLHTLQIKYFYGIDRIEKLMNFISGVIIKWRCPRHGGSSFLWYSI